MTHCFHGNEGGILGADGRVLPAAVTARERGVLFDVGHGEGSFAYQVARSALAQGFPPDTISSDLHAHNVDGPVFDQATTLSKLLHLGMDLEDVIRAATSTPAAAVRREARIGALAAGREADVTVFELRDGSLAAAGRGGRHRDCRAAARPAAWSSGRAPPGTRRSRPSRRGPAASRRDPGAWPWAAPSRRRAAARVVTPVGGARADVLITDGKIAAIGGSGGPGGQRLDAAGLLRAARRGRPALPSDARRAPGHGRRGARRDHDRALLHRPGGGRERPGRPAAQPRPSWNAAAP